MPQPASRSVIEAAVARAWNATWQATVAAQESTMYEGYAEDLEAIAYELRRIQEDLLRHKHRKVGHRQLTIT